MLKLTLPIKILDANPTNRARFLHRHFMTAWLLERKPNGISSVHFGLQLPGKGDAIHAQLKI